MIAAGAAIISIGLCSNPTPLIPLLSRLLPMEGDSRVGFLPCWFEDDDTRERI